MCGIFGVINTKEKIDEGRVLAARDVLAHRGPDDSGLYSSPKSDRSLDFARDDTLSSSTTKDDKSRGPFVALAHRRLSIIDLSPAAHQPMISKDSRYTIVYNGEIYNYKSLIPSPSPKEKGDFKSDSDTEVILHLYAEYGKDCLNMLQGMFAFAIWDDKEKTLFAARDRFGIKPFYYYEDDAGFIFSSELKAIKEYKKNLTINNDALDAFLRTGSVPAPMTIYNEVAALLPGHFLIMHNVKCTMYNYWEFEHLLGKSSVGSRQLADEENVISTTPMNRGRRNLKGNKISQSPDKSGSFEMSTTKNHSQLSIEHSKFSIKKSKSIYDINAKKQIKEALLDTVKAHMVADVEVGAFLSGGIDSTAIVSLMRQVGQEKIKTVSIVFPNNKLDESKYSRLAAKTYNTEHIEIPFYEKDLIEDFEKIMSVMDQPTIDGINTYFVSKAAKQAGLKVVLSGLGGDELFGGYPSFNLIPKYQRIKNLPFAKMFMKAAAPLLKNRLPAKAIEYMQNPDELNAEYKLIRGLFTNDELQKLGWNDKRQTSDVKRKTVDDIVISKRAGESEKSYSHHLPFNTKHSKLNYASSIEYPESSPPSLHYGRTGIQNLSSLQYVSMMETTHYMRNQLLRDSDVFSMAHSLELRVPFVDHKLYAAVLGYLDDAYDKNFPKKMLVEAVGDIPLELVNRPKMGFTFPFADWMMNGQLKDLMIKRIKDSDYKLNIEHSTPARRGGLNIDKVHWSRLWALFILSRYV